MIPLLRTMCPPPTRYQSMVSHTSLTDSVKEGEEGGRRGRTLPPGMFVII
jgi:hypothetical protein